MAVPSELSAQRIDPSARPKPRIYTPQGRNNRQQRVDRLRNKQHNLNNYRQRNLARTHKDLSRKRVQAQQRPTRHRSVNQRSYRSAAAGPRRHQNLSQRRSPHQGGRSLSHNSLSQKRMQQSTEKSEATE